MVPDTGNNTWIVLFVTAIVVILVFVGIIKLAKGKQSFTVPPTFIHILTSSISSASENTKRAPIPTSFPTLPGYDGTRATMDPVNPFLSVSLSSQHRRSSSTQSETVPLSTDFEDVVIEIPPPSYQNHTKDLKLPKPT